MKGLKNKMAVGVRIVVIVSAIVLEPAIFTYAVNTDEFGIISFSPGTTISSSQVNNNFQALINAMPRGAFGFVDNTPITVSSTPLTIASLSVTPRMDGALLIFVTASVSLGSSAFIDSHPSASSYSLCISQSSDSCGPEGGSHPIYLNAPSSPPIFIDFPITFFSAQPCRAGIPVTYYVTASTVPPPYGSGGSGEITGAHINAIFLPGGLGPFFF
jgi:hypothetical protein